FLYRSCTASLLYFFFQAEDGIRDLIVTGVQTCALPISRAPFFSRVPLPAPAKPAPPLPDPAPGHGEAAASALGRLRRAYAADERSEERRVGKECRSRWAAVRQKQDEQKSYLWK